MILKKVNDNFYWFQCPECGVKGHIDGDQAAGRVSIRCDNPAITNRYPGIGCGYHETKNWLEEEEK